MTSSARERAVEAGARAASPNAFDDAFWLARGSPDHHQKHAQANALKHAEAVIRAGMAIELEELAQKVEQMYRPHIGRHEMEERAAKVIAAVLRARIQQMAEAEHE